MTINVENNIGLAKYFTNKFYNEHNYRVEYDDLLQEALIGVWKASNKYDPDKGYTFSTFAGIVIMNQLKMYIRKQKKYKEEQLILDQPIGEDSGKEKITIADLQASIKHNTEDIVFVNDYIRYMMKEREKDYGYRKNKVLDREKTFFHYFINGYKQIEIIKKIGVSKRVGSNHQNSIRQRTREYLEIEMNS